MADKYVVHLKIIVDSEQEKDNLFATLNNLMKNTTTTAIAKGESREEKSFVSAHKCNHEKGIPCTDVVVINKDD